MSAPPESLIAAACGGAVHHLTQDHGHSSGALSAFRGTCAGTATRALVLGDVAVSSAQLPGRLGALLGAAVDHGFTERAYPLAVAVAWLYGAEAGHLLHAGPPHELATVVAPEELAEADVIAIARATASFPDATLVRDAQDQVELRFFTRWSAEVGGSGVAEVGLVAPNPTEAVQIHRRAFRVGADDRLPTGLADFAVAVDARRGDPAAVARRFTYVFRWGDAGGPAPWLQRLARGKRRLVERGLGATRALADRLAQRGMAVEPARVLVAGGSMLTWYVALTPRDPSGDARDEELWALTLRLEGSRVALDARPVAPPH